MPLLTATRNIIDLVEKLSGRPVHVSEDPSLKTLSTMTTARGDAPMHLIRYQPTGVMPPDYFIAYQCGFTIRLFMSPPDKRFDVGYSADGERKMKEAISAASASKHMLEMSEYLLSGLITQLRTYPVGLRIDQWIHEFYPELHDLQKKGVLIQLRQNTEAIKAGSSASFPRKVVKANLGMNAAYALFWSKRWNDDSLVLPFKAAGLLETGSRLLDIWNKASDDTTADMDLIDAWAFELGLKGWYKSTPYILNP